MCDDLLLSLLGLVMIWLPRASRHRILDERFDNNHNQDYACDYDFHRQNKQVRTPTDKQVPKVRCFEDGRKIQFALAKMCSMNAIVYFTE